MMKSTMSHRLLALLLAVLLTVCLCSCTPEEPNIDLEDQSFLDSLPYDYSYRIADGEVYFFGRWFESGNEKVIKATNCSGAEIFFMTDNTTQVKVMARSGSVAHMVYTVDDCDSVKKNLPIITIDLPDNGRHVVRITVDSVPDGGRWYGAGVEVYQIAPSEGGRIRAITPKNATVMYFGDSITEGCAALSIPVAGDDDSATGAYPYFCSAALNAVSYTVGHGGSGLEKVGSFETCINAINYLYQDMPADENFLPDVIVINHGTNDTVDYLEFVNRARICIEALQGKYPNVVIFYMVPICGKYLTAIRTVVSEYDNCFMVDTSGWNITFTDGLHPDVEGARVAGEKLALAILQELGEAFFVF